MTRDVQSSGSGTDLGLLSVHLLGLSSGLGSVNFIATLLYGRHSGKS